MFQFLNTLDHQCFEYIQSNLRSSFADPLFLAFRDKLCWIPLYLFLLSWLVFNYGASAWKPIVFVLLTVGITDQLNSSLVKSIFKRDRPCKEMYFKDQFTPVIECSGGYSFPSSHATNHMGIASFLFFTCRRKMKSWAWLLIFWALLVGSAQVYIGVHFPFDVIIGWAEGFVIGYLLFLILRHFLNWEKGIAD